MEKRGRVMTVAEAQNILETTSTKHTLVSWFQPFTSQMIEAIEKKKETCILDGRQFAVKKCANGKDYVFKVVGNFVPMTRVSLENLNSRLIADESVTR